MIARRTPALGTLGALLLLLLFALAAHAPRAGAAVSCPSTNPVLNENNCMGAGTTAYQMTNYSDNIAGFATKTSVNLGQDVSLKIGSNQPLTVSSKVDIFVYRMGSYGGLGGRLIAAAGKLGVPVNNTQACKPMDTTTGKLDCSNWATSYTIPGSTLPATGIYVVRIRTTDTGIENQIIFTVRDDARASKIQYILPIATYEAYNNWGGKSLYFDKYGGPTTVAGSDRAVKVSFDRPFDNAESTRNRFFGPDAAMVSWLEGQGYDVTYTDDVQASIDGASLKQHKALLINGHSEYWSLEQFNNVKAARDAGVNLASFSGNTSYWKIRYEDNYRTVVCYKTVEGNGSSGSVGANDWGPDGIKGTADDAVGADGKAGTADDNPQNATTTFRDNGAPQGDPNAPPEGRVGPDMPENELWGNMYVGDNEAVNFPLTVPAANAAGEYAGDRVWRNAGLPANATTEIGTDIVGWEWDQVPTQPQYLSRQPANVQRVSATDTTDPETTWLQDEGRVRNATPPPGQPSTVSAVRYTAASGARVFAAGTNQWANALDDARIAQATYNIISDMGVQPSTPSGVTLDSNGTPPTASFTVSPNPVKTSTTVTLDGGASSATSPTTITNYKWDLDGDGTFERDSGTSSTVTTTYAAEGSYDVHLKVTDSTGGTDIATRTLTVIDNQAPTASFTVSPNPAVTTQDVTLDATASSDPDGQIARYQWDLDGNGTYETDGGSNPKLVRSFSTAGTINIGLKVTDNGATPKTATASLPVTINSGGLSNYGDEVLRTAGLKDYWRLGETAGPAIADSKGTTTGTISGATFGVPGGPPGDPNTAISFNGSTDWGKAALDLSGTSQVTVEFWLKWTAYSNNDQLAMEFTPNFNDVDGGFLIDPNAPQFGGTFGIGIGRNGSRNNVFFARPSAGAWHHYAIVIDTTAPAATSITPYVDGQAVSYQKADSGTGAGSFANSTLFLMSRNGTALFGGGALDELAIYTKPLSASTIQTHAQSYGTNRKPTAHLTVSPSPARTGQAVTFDASASSDIDGTITKYQWDLDGDGTFEQTTTAPSVTRTYATEQSIAATVRVVDDQFGQDAATQTLFVGNAPPTAAFTATPNPAAAGQAVHLDASASADADGTVARYQWDLDGDGTYETDGGSSPTTTKAWSSTGTVPVGLKVTDAEGKSGTTSVPVTIAAGGRSNYGDAVLRTSGLVDYWRLGEADGSAGLADSKGTATATPANVTLGVPGAVSGDPSTAARFDGSSSSATAGVDLSGTSVTTVEFWLKWNHYANDDSLAMELTPNFNGYDGGFLVDPNAPQLGGTFGVAIGRDGARNNVFFARPSAGAWHHYAFVLDATAPAATQITPYVDGAPVAYQKVDSGTGAGRFANGSLYFMSRAGQGLFGSGDLDEVALYDRALTADEVADHAASWGTNKRPVASLAASTTTPRTGQAVTFDASASTDSDGRIVRYQWDLDGDGSYETDTGATVTKAYATDGPVTVRLKVTDDGTATDTASKAITVGNAAPSASFTATPTSVQVGDSVTLDASASHDADGTIVGYRWDLDGDGTYETDGGSAPTRTTSFASPGQIPVGLQVTDDDGATATSTVTVTVKAGTYASTVLSTTGLRDYWRMDDAAGSLTLADAAGSRPATLVSGTLGATGALGSGDSAASFNGSGDYAKVDLDLSDTSAITVEFWLKWNQFLGNDALAMEFTPNFNDNDGGFLVDPNAGSAFGVAIGRGGSRNNAFFGWPSAGAWHHYAFVLDATAGGATQVLPYVDGQPMTYFKFDSGTGAGSFANSTLYFMSRAGAALFGTGALDEVAIYGRALPASTIAAHYDAGTP